MPRPMQNDDSTHAAGSFPSYRYTCGIAAVITCLGPLRHAGKRWPEDGRLENDMPPLEDRERQFEAKYSRDQELQFKVQVRRNRLLGEWAAAEMGMTGEARDAYAKEVVASDFDKPGDEDVLQKVVGDLAARGAKADAYDVRKKMAELLAVAKKQVMSE